MSQDHEQLGNGQLDLRKLLTQTKVSELTLTHVPTLSPDQSLESVAAEMRNVSHGSALICDNGNLVGIITERDMLRLLSEGADFDAPVAGLMTESPKTLSPEDSLLEAVNLMDRGGYRRLPVVDQSGCTAGIVDVKTVMNYLVEQIPSTVYNQASSSLLTVRSAEGA